MEEKVSDSGVRSEKSDAGEARSAANETAKPKIPIARNANPAGISTARTVGDLPMEVTAEQTGSATETKPASDAESSQADYPIARNANPAGVSTSRTRD